MNREEFLEINRSGQDRSPETQGIDNLDLSNLDLRSLSIFRKNITSSNFSNSNLSNAKFTNVNMTHANFSNANMTNAKFTDGTWENANFISANLSNALCINMKSRHLDCPKFTHANCENIQIYFCSLTQTSFENANLKKAKISDSNMSGSNFSNVCLMAASCTAQHFVGVNFQNADLRNVDFSDANLNGSNFKDADLSYANLTNADLTCTNLTNANLSHAIVTGMKLEGAILENINLTGTIGEKATEIDRNTLGIQWRLTPETTDRLFIDVKDNAGRFSCGSDSDYPAEYDTYAVKDKFSLENLFKYERYLKPVELDVFWQVILEPEHENVKQQFIRGYQDIAQPVRAYIDDLEIYRLETNRLQYVNSEMEVYIILAKTKVGDWLGISVELGRDKIEEFRSDPDFIVRDFALTKPDHKELIIALNRAEEDASLLLRQAGGEYWGSGIAKVIWTLNEDRESAFVNLMIGTKHMAIVKYVSIPKIEELEQNESEDDDGEDDDCGEFNGQIFYFDRHTSRLIAENFTNLRYYYIGNVHIDMYLVGQSHRGDWLIIHTSVIWA